MWLCAVATSVCTGLYHGSYFCHQVAMLAASSPRGESGRQLLARLAPRPDLSSVLAELCPHHPVPGDIVEITGPCESHRPDPVRVGPISRV